MRRWVQQYERGEIVEVNFILPLGREWMRGRVIRRSQASLDVIVPFTRTDGTTVEALFTADRKSEIRRAS